MKPFTRLSLFIFLMVTGCNKSDQPDQVTVIPPQLILLGEDVSESFLPEEKLQPEELDVFCEKLLQNGVEATIYIGAIGNPSSKPFLKLELKPAQVVNPNEILSLQKQQATQRQKDIEKNKRAVETFIQDYVDKIYSRKSEGNTDVEGFFNKAELILNEPQYAHYRKTMWIHSDGLPDVSGQKIIPALEQSRFEEVDFYATGLQNKTLLKNFTVGFYDNPPSFFENFLFMFKSYNYEQ